MDAIMALKRYLLAAPMPHLCAFLTGVLGVWGLSWARFFLDQGRTLAAMLCLAVGGSLCWGALLAEADGLCRFREYQRVSDLVGRYGFRRRIFKVTSRSRCQRDAALLAAAERGCRGKVAALYRTLGYRWYHLIPDWVVGDPRHVLRPAFWRACFLPGKTRGTSSFAK